MDVGERVWHVSVLCVCLCACVVRECAGFLLKRQRQEELRLGELAEQREGLTGVLGGPTSLQHSRCFPCAPRTRLPITFPALRREHTACADEMPGTPRPRPGGMLRGPTEIDAADRPGLKRELTMLNDLYKQSLREEKTLEVNLEYEVMACKKVTLAATHTLLPGWTSCFVKHPDGHCRCFCC